MTADRNAEAIEVRIHPTAIVEAGVKIGRGSSVWDNVHIRRDARLGEECVVGEKSYIAYEVKIGSRVKINAMVYICYGVTIEDGVMISAGSVFTNDVFPRATTPDLASLRSSEPDDETQTTVVRSGATIGAGCTIGSGLEIGRFAMIGMGSVVTRSVGDYELVVGNPARSIGCVCRCGPALMKWEPGSRPASAEVNCPRCGDVYVISPNGVTLKEALA
ncbi:MAG: N-acetyltransferase [Planctomycetales bacterium]|nr:N-acetyltransferase [Planctomycetales bacterium]